MPIYRNFSPYTISIAKNSNRILSSSNDNFAGLKVGGFIKLDKENILYPVNKINKIFYVQDFELINSKTLKINSDVGINLQKYDIIKISYDEYELNTIISIPNKGINYNPEDELTVAGGSLNIDISNGIGYPTKLKVDSVNEKGEIESLSLIDGGKYITPPNGKRELFGGLGSNAEVELKYEVIPTKNIIERTISNIEIKDKVTILTLNYVIPVEIEKGSFSIEKYEAILGMQYFGETRHNIGYTIIKDFTPNLHLPLMMQNSLTFDLIYNDTVKRLDAEIAVLKEKIKQLEKLTSI